MTDARGEWSVRGSLAERLAGFSVQTQASSVSGAARAAVTVAVGQGERGLSFLLTRRAAKLRRHGGQFALPGGRVDPGETSAEAALRELHEELGIDLSPTSILGRLDDYSTRSGFVIEPWVVWCPEELPIVPNADEVATVYRVAFNDLDRPDSPRLRHIAESPRPVISLPIGEHWVHAPTAAIIYQAFELVNGRETRVAHFEQPTFAWR